MNHSEKVWKQIWTVTVKFYFTHSISFTKVTRWLQNNDLQLLEVDI